MTENVDKIMAVKGGHLDLLTFQEAAIELGFVRLGYRKPAEAVRDLCRTRRLRHVKVGRRVFIRRLWLEQFIERESVAPITEPSA